MKDMKIMYRTTDYSNKIEEKKIIKLYRKFVCYENEDGEIIKKLINGISYQWHHTKQEAIDHLSDQLKSNVESLESRLASAKHDLNEFENTHQ